MQMQFINDDDTSKREIDKVLYEQSTQLKVAQFCSMSEQTINWWCCYDNVFDKVFVYDLSHMLYKACNLEMFKPDSY